MAQRDMDIYTNGICFMFEATECFIYQVTEADWLMRAHESRCIEVSKTWPSFVSVNI